MENMSEEKAQPRDGESTACERGWFLGCSLVTMSRCGNICNSVLKTLVPPQRVEQLSLDYASRHLQAVTASSKPPRAVEPFMTCRRTAQPGAQPLVSKP